MLADASPLRGCTCEDGGVDGCVGLEPLVEGKAATSTAEEKKVEKGKAAMKEQEKEVEEEEDFEDDDLVRDPTVLEIWLVLRRRRHGLTFVHSTLVVHPRKKTTTWTQRTTRKKSLLR